MDTEEIYQQSYHKSNSGCLTFTIMLIIILSGVGILRFLLGKGAYRPSSTPPPTEEVDMCDTIVSVDSGEYVDLDSLTEKVRRDNEHMDSIQKALEKALKEHRIIMPKTDTKASASPAPAPSSSRTSSANSDGFFAGYYDGYEDGMEEEHGATYNPGRGSGRDYRAGYAEGYERGFEDGLEEVARRY